MGDVSIPTIIVGASTRPPLDDALQPLENKPFITLEKDATPVQRIWAAFSGDPERLDLGDVFQALVEPYLFGNLPEIKEKLKAILGYRPNDPLLFKNIPLTATQQLALTIIEPPDRTPEAPVLVFATGFAHPASLYVPHMLALAKALRTKVVLFDAPGSGGSQSSTTVDHTDFYKALKEVITHEVPVGRNYFVGGHSLGSAPVYQLYQEIKTGKAPVGQRTLVRAVVINPIPSRLHETSGTGTIAREFMTRGVLSEVAHGFTALKSNSLSLFDNDLPEKVAGRRIVAREEVPISVPGMLKIYGSIDANDPTLDVGQDPRIAVVLSRDDHLMNWDDQSFALRRGYRVIDGDHGACLTGTFVTAQCTAALADAFSAPLYPQHSPISAGETYHHANGMVRMGLQSWMRLPSLAITPEIAIKYGIASFGQGLGIYLGSGIVGELGYQFGRQARGIAAPQGQVYLGLEGLRLPVDAKLGAQAGVDFLSPSERPLLSALTTTVGVNVARIFDIEAQARFTVSGQFQDAVAGLKLRFN